MTKTLTLKAGDVFSIPTKSGYGFIQFIEMFPNEVEFVRVLQPVLKEQTLDQNQVNLKERFCIQFPLKPAYNRDLIKMIGSFDVPKSFQTPNYFRSKHFVRGEFKGWHIVEVNTLKRTLVKELTQNQQSLSPYGIFNDTLLKERIENDWTLEDWV